MADFTIKQGDTAPVFEATLKGSDGTTVQDLTGCTVKFNMKKSGNSTVKIDHGTCTVTSAAGGIVQYAWQAADTNTAGDYEAEMEVTFANGKITTWPNTGNWTVEIVQQIA